MADVNLTQEEMLTLEGLGYFKKKQDALNDQKIATAKQEAKDYAKEYADGLADNYDAAGTAQTKVNELANGAVKENTEAIAKLNGDAETDGSVAKAVADAVKKEEDARVEAVADIQSEVDTLEQIVADNKTAVEARVKAIEDDYLVEADKSELQGNIDTLAGKVTENTQAISTLNGEGEGSVKKTVDNAINKFATDITDDAVVNSYKELIDWVAEHGSEAAEMAEAIQTNKTDIAELEALVGTLPEGTTATTVVALIQSLVNAEQARAEDVEGGLDTRLQAVEAAIGEGGSVTNAIAEAKQAGTDASAEVTALAEGVVADNAQAIADIQAAMPTAITNAQIDTLFAEATA